MRSNRACFMIQIFLAGIALLVLLSLTGAAKTITVAKGGAGDHSGIQDAIDAADEGDTIRVYEGKYTEHIRINKTLVVQGNGSSVTEIYGELKGIMVNISTPDSSFSGFRLNRITSDYMWETTIGVLVAANRTTVQNVMSLNNSYGILLDYVNNNVIRNNICSDNNQGFGVGINVDHSSHNAIANNICNNNAENGIYIDRQSDYNTVENNTCSKNNDGITLKFADNNTVINNNCTVNRNGIQLKQSHNNKLEDNSLHDNLYYEFTVILPRIVDGCAIALIDSDHNTFRSNTCTVYNCGLYLYNSFHNTIQDNVFSSGEYGMYNVDSGKNTISGNTLSGNGQDRYGFGSDDENSGFLPGFGTTGTLSFLLIVVAVRKKTI